MASPFWTYFNDKLRWALINVPGPVAAVIKGLAHRFDLVRDDALFLRDQGFPQRCETDLVPLHGDARGITRHHTETLEQFRQRVINAYAWHMLGGKWEGLPQILKFYGFEITEVENMRKYQPSRWAEFQVGLPSGASVEEQSAILEGLEMLVWLINENKPARSVLARLYNDVYNITPLIWSDGNYSEHFYTHFSGVPAFDLGGDWKDDGLILSFGQRLGILIERPDFDGTPVFSGWQNMSVETRYIDAPVWSYFAYSDNFPDKHGFTIFNLLTLDWCEKISTSHRWDGAWDSRHWAEPATWDRILPEWTVDSYQLARSQLVYSHEFITANAGLWGGANACYGVPTTFIIESPPIWGSYHYSGDTGRQQISIHEQYHETRGLETEPRDSNDPELTAMGLIGIACAPLHNQTWTGTWDSRRWWNYGAFTSIACDKE